jgi:hypothetical protein
MGVEVELRITHPSHSLSQSIGCHGQLGTLKGRGSTDCESNVRIASKNDTVLILILGRAWWDKQTTLSHNPQPPSHYRMFDDWNREPRTANPKPLPTLRLTSLFGTHLPPSFTASPLPRALTGQVSAPENVASVTFIHQGFISNSLQPRSDPHKYTVSPLLSIPL